MTATVRELAELVHGTWQGDPDQVITEARSLTHAGPGQVSFLDHRKHARLLTSCKASAVVVPEGFPAAGGTLIRCKDPLTAFIAIVEHLRGREQPPPPGVDPRAVVHSSARLGPDCSVQALATIGEGSVLGAHCRIYPGAVVGRNCRLGDDVTLHPNVVLYERCVLGNRVIIHANAVLGADGFGYRVQQGRHVKVPQLGHVEIGDDVEIGACATIDRGMVDATRVGPGTKIDNLVMIAHNCDIGAHNVFAAQVGIAGSCTTGAYVVLAGQVGIADHTHIGNQAVIGAQSGVSGDVPAGARLFGYPAGPEREQKRILATMGRLPEMRRDLQRIKSLLELDSEDEAA